MIPDRMSLLREIQELEARKKLREQELEKFLEQVRLVRKETENLDAQIKSRWAIYNKFFRKDE
jgi:phage shock protein A